MQALAEARRVLKPGGRFLCLEFSRVEAPGLDALYERYSFSRAAAARRDGWRRTARPIAISPKASAAFRRRAAFAKMIERAGLSRVKVRNLTGGIAAMHSAWRI